MTDERRPIDLINESVGITTEAAYLAEHIKDTDPQWQRKELLDQLVGMIDDAHESALKASVELEDD